MDLSTQLENHEQRCSFANTMTLRAVMPGGQELEKGVTHIVCKLPKQVLVESYQAWIPADGGKGWGADVTVDFGTVDNPTFFFDNVTIPDEGATHNAPETPFMHLLDAHELVVKVTTSGTNPGGIIMFNMNYTELDTKAGKYAY